MKRFITLVCILCAVCMLFPGCAKEPTISADVEAILNAACNTPNADLHDPDCFTYPGMPEDEKAAALQRLEELNKNWENLVGEYFSPGSLDLFLSSYLRSFFFADDPLPSELVSMTLVSQDEKCEIVDVQVNVDGKTVELTVTFRRNDDGLLYRVDMVEKHK